jgi:hypothetical protein
VEWEKSWEEVPTLALGDEEGSFEWENLLMEGYISRD